MLTRISGCLAVVLFCTVNVGCCLIDRGSDCTASCGIPESSCGCEDLASCGCPESACGCPESACGCPESACGCPAAECGCVDSCDANCGCPDLDCGCADNCCEQACGCADTCCGSNEVNCGSRCKKNGGLLSCLGRLFGCGSCAGCGCELYWSEWHNDPPACCEPCDCYGNYNGPGGGYYRAPYRRAEGFSQASIEPRKSHSTSRRSSELNLATRDRVAAIPEPPIF